MRADNDIDDFEKHLNRKMQNPEFKAAWEDSESQLIHLCNDCEYGCMAACPITKNVKFGNGLGNDNVIECENYINKEALKKWQINQIISKGVE